MDKGIGRMPVPARLKKRAAVKKIGKTEFFDLPRPIAGFNETALPEANASEVTRAGEKPAP
ncbi:hypothetical protein [Rhizobium sp. SG2393]|uniref:hypothetical protein n=1 Tax=Rhizobium sp. SG2393 TaxID=3276279 RepID=UPI003672BA27